MSQPQPDRRSYEDREAVLLGLPRHGLLRRASEVQAFAPKRMSLTTVEAILHQLWEDGLIVRREPFDVGLPERWGHRPISDAPDEGSAA